MTEKTITCITCPTGCDIIVHGEGDNIVSMEGYACKRGEEYARNEFIHPVRILTSTVRVEGASCPLVAVRSSQPVPKELQMACMEQIRHTTATAPVARYDVFISDILGTGVDIIATGEIT